MIGLVISFIVLWDYSYDITTRFTYDNNIFAYSSDHIDDFLNQIRPYRFPFETYDDAMTTSDITLYFRNKFFGNKTTTVNISFDHRYYIINHQKNYHRFGGGLRQSFGKWAVKASYMIIPSYLIRYYREPEGNLTDYIECEATYHTISGKLSLRLTERISLAAVYNHRWDDFVSAFNLYDARSHILGLNATYSITKRIKTDFSYRFRNSQNDTIELLTATDEDVPDGSFYQQSMKGTVRFTFKAILPTQLALAYQYRFRNYSTTLSEDSFHFGRQDHVHTFDLNATFRMMAGLNMVLSFQRQWRNATSEVFLEIDEFKDYNKYKLSGGLNLYH